MVLFSAADFQIKVRLFSACPVLYFAIKLLLLVAVCFLFLSLFFFLFFGFFMCECVFDHDVHLYL